MSTTRRPFSAVPILVSLVMTHLHGASGQEAARPARPLRSVEELNAYHDRRLADLERQRLADLDALASVKAGTEGNSAYRELFLRAIARDLTVEASPAADRCLAGSSAAADVRALATLVASIVNTNHGQPDRALARFSALVADRKRAGAVDSEPLLAAGETFLRYLIRAARYDEARRLCSLLAEKCDEGEVSAHFASTLRPLKLVGRPLRRLTRTTSTAIAFASPT